MSEYTELLAEMITLLEEAEALHWESWFRDSLRMASEGNLQNSYQRTLGGYGGMGSFNDVFWDLPKEKYVRLELIKGLVWQLAKDGRE